MALRVRESTPPNVRAGYLLWVPGLYLLHCWRRYRRSQAPCQLLREYHHVRGFPCIEGTFLAFTQTPARVSAQDWAVSGTTKRIGHAFAGRFPGSLLAASVATGRPKAALNRMAHIYVRVSDTKPLRDGKLVCQILLRYGRACEIRVYRRGVVVG